MVGRATVKLAFDRLHTSLLRLLSTLCVLVAIGCADPSAVLPSADVLHSALSAAVKRGPGAIVSLDSVIGGDWRTLYVFGPYTPSTTIDRCVGMRVNHRDIDARDGINLLVLKPAKGRASSVVVARDVDFGPEAVGRAYSRGAASFAVRLPSPQAWGHLVPASGAMPGMTRCN